MSRIDASGRLTSQAVSHVLNWQPGDRLTLTTGAGADRPLAGRQRAGTRGRFVERRQARQAHDKARERYEGLTKAELSDQLAKRQLPKSGNLDELIERLAEADSR
jgi:hypothetical protein